MLIQRIATIAVLAAALWTPGHATCGEQPDGVVGTAKFRVGTYDSRSVALAFGRSEFLSIPYKEWKAESDAAKERGDQERVEEIEADAEALQNLRHMQVFGNAPIHDMLKTPYLKKNVDRLAEEKQLQLVVRRIDLAYLAPWIELVDITEELVACCKPTEKTLTIIEAMKEHDPLPLERFPIDCDHGGHE